MRPSAERLFTGMLMLAAILMAWTQSAHSTLVAVEDAVEAHAEDVSLPLSAFGLVSVRTCAGCPPRVFRASGDTRYLLDGAAVEREALLAAAAEPSHRDGIVVVFFATGTDRVTRIGLAAPAGGARR